MMKSSLITFIRVVHEHGPESQAAKDVLSTTTGTVTQQCKAFLLAYERKAVPA